MLDDKVDLVMWTKNGEKFLPKVLKRIEEVIPFEHINQKIVIDDNSTDKTARIAKDFNWTVYKNSAGGIASGVEEALRRVKCKYFVSIEQDVLLAKDWWEKVPPFMDEEDVACAQGIRVSINPTLRLLEEYAIKERKMINVSIDNNIFKTKVVKALGKVPKVCPVCVDSAIMKQMVWKTTYKWVTIPQVVSLHLSRDSVWNHVQHCRRISRRCKKTIYCSVGGIGFSKTLNSGFWRVFRIFITSPFRGLELAVRKKHVHVAWAYPLIRLYNIPESIREWKKVKVVKSMLKKNLPTITLKFEQRNESGIFVWQRENY